MSSLAKKRQRIASSLSTSLDDLDEDVLLEILSYLYFVDLSETISVLSKSFLKISLTARVRHVCRPSVPRERLISREYDHYSLPFPDLMPDEKFGQSPTTNALFMPYAIIGREVKIIFLTIVLDQMLIMKH